MDIFIPEKAERGYLFGVLFGVLERTEWSYHRASGHKDVPGTVIRKVYAMKDHPADTAGMLLKKAREVYLKKTGFASRAYYNETIRVLLTMLNDIDGYTNAPVNVLLFDYGYKAYRKWEREKWERRISGTPDSSGR